MNIEQMKTVLKEILTNTDLTPCVVGHRGVGKTAGIIQVCREIERSYIPLRLGQMEVGDLVGIPYREAEVMHWSRPVITSYSIHYTKLYEASPRKPA